MKIKSFEIFYNKIELKRTFTTSLGSMPYSKNIFVKVILENGTYGWGESAPHNKINGELIESCLSIAPILTSSLIGKNIFDHDEIYETLERCIYRNSSIKAAIDIACYDAASKEKNLPLYKYLGGEVNKKLYTDYTVSLDSKEKMAEEAKSIMDMGLKIIKVKLGRNGKEDVKRIHAIRSVIGDTIKLRLDANQGWEIDEAIQTLKSLEKYKIEYCEAPIDRELSYRLNEVKSASPIKIMADESLFNSNDAQMLVDGNHCDMFNIKLGKSGGIREALKIISIAEKNNIEMQIGGFLESKIVFTANCHLAYQSDLIKNLDCDSPLFHKQDPVIGGLEYCKDWEMKIHGKPGLNIELDNNFLNSCHKIKC